jgi:hypothetical protein
MRFLAVWFLLAIGLRASDRCDSPSELTDFIQSLPAEGNARRGAIEEKLRQTPTISHSTDDSSVYKRRPIPDGYQELLKSHPDRVDYQYLRGRSLVGNDTKEALRLYLQILDKDPDYPCVHPVHNLRTIGRRHSTTEPSWRLAFRRSLGSAPCCSVLIVT